MTDTNLLRCPFCGSEPEIINTSIHCNNALCEAQPFVGGRSHEHGEAIAAWNRRAAVEELRRAAHSAWITGTPDFRRHYDKELLAVLGCAEFSELEASRLPLVGALKQPEVVNPMAEWPWVTSALAGAAPSDERTCTCHPDDNPPQPCPRKFSLNECRDAAVQQPPKYVEGFLCRAWGEMDLPEARLVRTPEEWQAFVVEMQWGPHAKYDTIEADDREAVDAQVRYIEVDMADNNEGQINFEIGGISVARVTFLATSPLPTAPAGAREARFLTLEEVHAALPQPSNYPKGGFKGTTYVQMTWRDFNEWARNLQIKFAAEHGITLAQKGDVDG